MGTVDLLSMHVVLLLEIIEYLASVGNKSHAGFCLSGGESNCKIVQHLGGGLELCVLDCSHTCPPSLIRCGRVHTYSLIIAT